MPKYTLYLGVLGKRGAVQEAVKLVAPFSSTCSSVWEGDGKETKLPVAGASIWKPFK